MASILNPLPQVYGKMLKKLKKMSTYQDSTTLGVVLGQECKGVFLGAMAVMVEKGVQSQKGRMGAGTILTNEEFIVPHIVWDVWGVCFGRGKGGAGMLLELQQRGVL